MGESRKLSIGEFLSDIRLVMTSPGRRFGVIQERGAVWGSLLLMAIPLYIGFDYVGGIYFQRDPFPGYSFIPPVLAAAVTAFLKMYLIHVFARMFQGRELARESKGSFSQLVAVFGYTGVPALLAIMLATALFLLLPEALGSFMHNFRVVFVSVMIALGIALFIWNLILVVLALRSVYRMRDIKIVSAFILGSVLMIVPALCAIWLVRPVKVDFLYVQPIITNRILRFFASDTAETQSTRISVHIDRLTYRLRDPERFELVAFQRREPKAESGSTKEAVVVGTGSHLSWEEGNLVVGRIVGLPGDTVALADGILTINGQAWVERYIPPEYRTDTSLPPVSLGPSEYLVLPENRRLIGDLKNEIVVSRNRIRGRELITRWPMGWLTFRPTVFLQAQPAGGHSIR